jgi:hypothetical protein
MRPPLDRLLWTCSLLLAAAKQTDSPSRSATAWKPAAIMTQNWAKSNRGNRMFPRSYSPASCRSNIAARQTAHEGPAKPPRDHRLRAADVTAATTRLYTRYAGPSASWQSTESLPSARTTSDGIWTPATCRTQGSTGAGWPSAAETNSRVRHQGAHPRAVRQDPSCRTGFGLWHGRPRRCQARPGADGPQF